MMGQWSEIFDVIDYIGVFNIILRFIDFCLACNSLLKSVEHYKGIFKLRGFLMLNEAYNLISQPFTLLLNNSSMSPITQIIS